MYTMSNVPFVKLMTAIGIAGVTCGGKTSLANRMVTELPNAVVVSQDDFFLPVESVNRIDDFYDYDSPTALDIPAFCKAVNSALELHHFVLVEGSMIVQLPSIEMQLVSILFITLPKCECRLRRSVRIDYVPSDPPEYFDRIVWPAYSNILDVVQSRHDRRYRFVDGTTLPAVDELLRELVPDLVRIQKQTIQVDELVDFVTTASSGAVSLFIGTTRDNFEGRKVFRLEYEAYTSMAMSELRKLCSTIRSRFPNVHRIAIIHRIGMVHIMEASVVIATSSPHRNESIKATEFAIDQLKRTIPIWKKEIYDDGSASWKENCECKQERAI